LIWKGLGAARGDRANMRFVGRGLFILFTVVLLSGCSTPEITPNEGVIPNSEGVIPNSERVIPNSERVIPEESEFTYSISISVPLIQISGGNLHWHKKLPNNTYTLEDVAIEIYNFGDSDISVAQLEIRVDGNSKLFDIGAAIFGKTKENVIVQPMMEGYDGGIHIIYVALLDENGGILYENNGEEIGPLEPIQGTGSWKSVLN
jgi:hypothetical protein